MAGLHGRQSLAIPAAGDDGVRRFAHEAMATLFEVLIVGEAPEYARQAADAAFDEVDGVERQLSRFIPHSDVSRINALKERERIRIGPAAFDCLALARRVHAETCGAFDVTVGALVDVWDEGNAPPDAVSDACRRSGMKLLALDEDDKSVGVRADGVVVDLGGIGKGYALDRAAALLREWSVGTALIHAGSSSVLALGSPAGGHGWPVDLRDPFDPSASVDHLFLTRGALSGSGTEVRGRHIIDPRSGRPAAGRPAAWAVAPSAAVSDALSTAFMVMAEREVGDYCARHPGTAGLLLAGEAGATVLRRFPPQPEATGPAGT